MITELNVPGVKLEFLKRPHDLTLRLLVQDFFLVDRIQTFGPEYEIVICSSGRYLLGPSPTPSSTMLTSSWDATSSWATPTPSMATPNQSDPLTPAHTVFEKDPDPLFGLSHPTMKKAAKVSELLSEGGSRGALLTLTYKMLKPQSPHHPAVQEAMEEGGGREEDEEGEGDGSREPVIHRVNIQCTAVDAIGMYIYNG